MNSTFLDQFYLLIIYLITGIMISTIFDVFRISRKVFKTSNIITYIEDIAFIIITITVLTYSILKFNDGIIRSYIFIGLFIGILGYFSLISKHFLKIGANITNLIKKIILKTFEILLIPFKFIGNILKKIFFKPITFLIINIRHGITKKKNKIQTNSKNKKKVPKKVKKEKK